MYCTSCGSQNEENARFCGECGRELSEQRTTAREYAPEPLTPPAHIPNYLVQAILVTIFCCLPVGIVSIVYAAQVNVKLAAGDVSGAMKASSSAKTWAWVAFGTGLVIFTMYMIWGASNLTLSGWGTYDVHDLGGH